MSDQPDQPDLPEFPGLPVTSHALDPDVDVEETEPNDVEITLGSNVNVDDRDTVVEDPEDFDSDVNDQVDP